MAFPRVPPESKSQINKAGGILAHLEADEAKFRWAIDLANRWRACHAYPINTFQATLRVKLKGYPGTPVAAQRLKRMPTIIDKLRRYHAMKLTTMQDIAGVRAVVASPGDVFKLADSYRNNTSFPHELVDQYDYIGKPRDEDGYRSLHLVYKYKNSRNPAYDDLRIELQIRTRLQHIWATAVETMGTFLGQALKSRQGDKAWLDFFAITSCAIALREKTPPLPRYSSLSKDDLFEAIKVANTQLDALEKMRGFSIAVDAINKGRGKGTFYHLIVLNSLEKTVEIRGYDRESFSRAVDEYSEVEKEATDGKKIEPVLVSAGRVGNLRRAYPNFFLDMDDFLLLVQQILDSGKRAKKGQ